MENILENEVFVNILMIGGFVIPWLLALIFKQTQPKPQIKRIISNGLALLMWGVAILISKVYAEWTTVAAWIFGLIANFIYFKMIYEVVIKTFLPESWRKALK